MGAIQLHAHQQCLELCCAGQAQVEAVQQALPSGARVLLVTATMPEPVWLQVRPLSTSAMYALVTRINPHAKRIQNILGLWART